MHGKRWLEKRRRGQALVEFALIAPILCLMVLGIIEFGRAWNVFQTITDTAREANRAAVIADPLIDTDSVYQIINNRLVFAGLDSTKATKQILGAFHGQGPVGIRLHYAYHLGWIDPFMNWATGQASITLKTESVMRSEW
jgi:Flp pilus assembly protein TadG